MASLLSIDQTAEALGVSPLFVRRAIDRTRAGIPGGWPSKCWLNLSPEAGKATIRIDLDALKAHLREAQEV